MGNVSLIYKSGSSLIAYTDGIYHVNLSYLGIHITKKLNKSDKIVYETVINSGNGDQYMAMSDPTCYTKNDVIMSATNITFQGISYEKYNPSQSSNLAISQSIPSYGSVNGYCLDFSNNKAYRYNNGTLACTYDFNSVSYVVSPSLYDYFKISIADYICTSNVSINFGENGLKYSYPGYTSVYDAKEYLSIKDLEKIKKIKQY